MTRPIDAKTQAGAGKPSSGNSATTAQDRARTARGVRAARVVLSTMWGHAAGKFSLIVLGLWLASSAVSLVWTPYSLWSTDGYHVWAKRRATTGWEPTAPVRRVQLVAGRLPHQPADRRADRGRRCDVRTGHRGVDGVQARGAFGGIGGRRRRADIHSHGADRADSRRAVGPSVAVIVIACGFGYGLNLARVSRPQAMLAARSSYVESALSNGASGLNVLARHILPNISPVLTVQLSLSAGTAVLAESGLTYLGIGVPSGVPSWGHSLATSVKFINVYPLTVLWPGLIVTLVVVALNLFGDALRDAADPLTNHRLRGAR